VLTHLDAAYRFARWLCLAPADAEDVVQEAVLLAYRAFDSTRITDAKSWLLAIVRNCHLSSVRSRKRRPSVSLAEVDESAFDEALQRPVDPADAHARQEGERVLERLLAQLPTAHRELLVLRELEELSYREIAALMSIPLGTVMSRLSRARDALKEAWQTQQRGSAHDLH
jgi:RNA polymerase sigma-70 factor, ECF subfamily